MSLRHAELECIEALALGGASEVHLARRRLADGRFQRVVVKRAREPDDVEHALLLRDEGRLLARLSHPGVIGLVSSGEDARGPFLVLDHVDGVTLRRLTLAARASSAPALLVGRVLLDVAEALTYLHDQADPVVHRDLTPSNVLADVAGHARLIDFGIAYAGGRVYETGTGVIKGTIGYMAPEQLEGRSDAGSATDVFALGVCAHEALAGRHPFLPVDPLTLERRVRGAEFPPLGGRVAVPAALAAMLDRALAPDPAARPTAREVADALRPWVGGVSRADVGALVVRSQLAPAL